jgi:hypothetical protein
LNESAILWKNSIQIEISHQMTLIEMKLIESNWIWRIFLWLLVLAWIHWFVHHCETCEIELIAFPW